MVATADSPPVLTESEIRKRSYGQTQESKRYRLKQALLLAEILMEAAGKMREQVSQPAPAGETEAQAEARKVGERAAAGVASRCAIAWRSLADGIRELKGEPLSGHKRPLPEELKQPKQRAMNAPPEPM